MKRTFNLLAGLVVLAILAAGCSGFNPPVGTQAAPATVSATNVPSATPTLPPQASATVAAVEAASPSPEPGLQNPHYQIQASFDYYQHTLTVIQQLSFTNPGPDAFNDLVFAVEADNQQGVFNLKSVSLGEDQAISGYTLAKNRLEIALGQPLFPGESSTVSFAYDLTLPVIPPPSDTAKPVIFGYTERQTNLVDWFPYLTPYLAGTGWILHSPGYYGENQVYPIADFDVEITLINPPAGLKLAAPGQDAQDSTHFILDNARTFAWSASPSYTIMSQTVGDVTVFSYSFPLDDGAARMVLQNTADAVGLYSRLFSPYQHKTLTVVEADFFDGMEFDGLYFLSKGFYNLYDGTPKGYLTAIAVHETAHQWWFAQVANDQALEPWLDEALATYSERIFYENVYPDLVDWWWSFRVNFYQPGGFIDQSIYDYGGFTPYRNAVYLRGALFLEKIRGLAGDDAFFAFLQDYAKTEKYKIATASDFFSILARDTGLDINQVKNGFFK